MNQLTIDQKYQIARAALRQMATWTGRQGVIARDALAACHGHDDPGARAAAALPQSQRESDLRGAIEAAAAAARRLPAPLDPGVVAVLAPICARASGPCVCGGHRDREAA